MGADFTEEAELLAARRMPIYRALADAVIATSTTTADALAALDAATA
jgi:hypothetical protein